MRSSFRPWMLGFAALSVAAGSWVLAQQGPTPVVPQGTGNAASVPAQGAPPAQGAVVAKELPRQELPPPPPANAVAATVNGQAVPETAVYRALIRSEGKKPDEVRKEILTFLIDTTLVDQYLVAIKVEVDKKEIDERVEQMKKEAADQKESFEKLLKDLHLTMEELRYQIAGAIRWEKFVNKQGTEKVLKDFFDKNPSMFDGNQVHARHILIAAGDGPQAQDQAKTKAAALKKQIEDYVTGELGRLPAQTSNLEREKKRVEVLDKIFAELAAKESSCPSKERGGDVEWFRRAGDMVEPFARAAFALKPYQMSDVVHTEFGYHVILSIDQKAGKQPKFDDIKPFVLEVYQDRLREAIVAQVKPSAKIVINPAPK
jgi:peptidyl-prolyl cis-trans isomerase C